MSIIADHFDENVVDEVHSPFVRPVIITAAVLTVMALLVISALRSGKMPEATFPYMTRLLVLAHVMRGVGEGTLLCATAVGLSRRDHCPKFLFAIAILALLAYHATAAYGYFFGFSGFLSQAIQVLFVVYIFLGLLLSLSIMMYFEGKLWHVFCLLALSLATGFAINYIYHPLLLLGVYILNKILAIWFVIYLANRFYYVSTPNEEVLPIDAYAFSEADTPLPATDEIESPASDSFDK